MKKRFTEAQIAFALRQTASGTSVAEISRKVGVSDVTFYRWKMQFARLGVAEIRWLRQLEEEDHCLKRLVADLTLDKQMLQDVLSKKLWSLPFAANCVGNSQLGYRTSERRVLRAFRWPRSAHRQVSTADPQLALRLRLRELAGVRVAYGYRRLHVLSRREG